MSTNSEDVLNELALKPRKLNSLLLGFFEKNIVLCIQSRFQDKMLIVSPPPTPTFHEPVQITPLRERVQNKKENKAFTSGPRFVWQIDFRRRDCRMDFPPPSHKMSVENAAETRTI